MVNLQGYSMSKKILPTLSTLLSLATLLSVKWYPSLTSLLGISLLLCTLAGSVLAVFEKHNQTENARSRVYRDVLILTATFIIVVILGGLAGLLAIYFVSLSFGMVMGFACAFLASLLVGYIIKQGVARFFGV